MKKTLIAILSIAGVLTSCSVKNLGEECEKCKEKANDELCSVKLSVNGRGYGSRTRAAFADSAVNTLSYFIFNAVDGKIINTYSSEGDPVEFFLTPGTYDFYAVANYGSTIVPPADTAALLDNKFSLRDSESSGAGIQMIGRTKGYTVAGDDSVSIAVDRCLSKVSFIVNTSFIGAAGDEKIWIIGAFCTNVQTENNLGLSSYQGDSGKWVNKMKNDSLTSYQGILWHSMIKEMTALSDRYEATEDFYIMPNASADKSVKGGEWSSRCTRLVLEVICKGKKCYYPVSFEGVKPNRHYTVEVTLTRPGYDNPEGVGLLVDYMTATVTVAPWEEGGTFSESF